MANFHLLKPPFPLAFRIGAMLGLPEHLPSTAAKTHPFDRNTVPSWCALRFRIPLRFFETTEARVYACPTEFHGRLSLCFRMKAETAS
jgi:hypothetical protein